MANFNCKYRSVFKNSVACFSILLLFSINSCKSKGEIVEIKINDEAKQEIDNSSKTKIELSVGPGIKIEDAELRDFKDFMVWVTTRKMDTIGNCKLKKVVNIKGIDTLPHFFVKFQTLPIVYKMKIENHELVFAILNKSGTN